MRQGLFRQAALERLSSPERLDELMEVTTPRSWLALLGIGAVLVAALVWAVYGSVPTLVKAQGVLIREGSLQSVDAPAAGELRELLVNAGDDVVREQLVARIYQAVDDRTVVVTSPYAGRVVDVRVTRGNLVGAGTALLSLEQPGRSLEAVLYLPPIDGTKLLPGMEVQLSPASVKREEHGLLLGRVSAVSAFPATISGMKRVLGSEELAKALSDKAPPIEVHVELVRNPTTTSGYQWTSTLSTLASGFVGLLPDPLVAVLPGWATPQGPLLTLASGTICTADVITEQQAPIYLVLAKFNW
jgi:hypothetical protein